MWRRPAESKLLCATSVISGLAFVGFAHGQSLSTNLVATHQLGFSGTLVSVREDYQHSKFPIAHRKLILRGPNGRVITLALKDGGPGELAPLSLYVRENPVLDSRGHAVGGDFLLIGARECVGFDPVFLEAARCISRPPCEQAKKRSGLLYLGRFDWANGFDPPRGRFQFGWRFLPVEDGIEESFCPDPR